MSLSPGDRLGDYEIETRIGTGGMGEVYKAKDGKLDRIVAIKLLTPPPSLSRAAALEFFRSEEKVLAALDHDNITHLYGHIEHGDTFAFAMEYVDGPTLQELLALRSLERLNSHTRGEWRIEI
jgi:serine/threonine-protein kinase